MASAMAQPQSRTTFPRRSFLKWSTVTGGAAALVGTAAHFGAIPGVGSAEAAVTNSDDYGTPIWSSCNVNCQSRCPLRLFVKDGQVVRVETDNTGSHDLGDQQVRACVRGRSVRQRIYNPDRIKTPMRRKAGTERGAGEWEEISWGEALDLVASEISRVKDTYGNDALYSMSGSGANGANIGSYNVQSRLFNLIGGTLGWYGSYSAGAISFIAPYVYGSSPGSNTFDDIQNASLVVLWGNNPLETRMGGESYVIQQAKKKSGVKVIVIDPRYSETAADLADEWVPIRPGTDPALVAGLAHVLITENLVDQEFLDKYVVGFDEDHMPEGVPVGNSYRSYVLGEGPDGVEKTPAWASDITGAPAETIVRIAREIGHAKPCHITQGWGNQRHMNGENSAWAVFTIAQLTGNVGIPGGGTGDRESSWNFPVARFPMPENPVKASIPRATWTDAVERGTEMTAVADGVKGVDQLNNNIKLIFHYAGNTMINQHMNINHTIDIVKDESKVEFIVLVENHMTSSAQYADLVLPGTTNFEQSDLVAGGSTGELGYAIYADKVIDPLFETRTIYEICTGLAQRLGVEEEFTEGKTEEEWLAQLMDETRELTPEFPKQEDFREMGVFRMANPDGFTVPLKDFREDPEANPLPTPSGKIEMFSKQLWDLNETWEVPDGGRITAIAEHVPDVEGVEGARENSDYPLQMIGHHYKSRTHSSYGNVEWLKELHPQVVWINPADAEVRSIRNEDLVSVFNDRGKLEIEARVTPRIAPGVISVPQGSWLDIDQRGVDVGGNINSLTSFRTTWLGKATSCHTNLVNVSKVKESASPEA